jgi:hypothetical protein
MQLVNAGECLATSTGRYQSNGPWRRPRTSLRMAKPFAAVMSGFKQSLVRPQSTTTATCDLRPARQAKHITLTTVSRLERGHQRNDTLANNYRQWLTAA